MEPIIDFDRVDQNGPQTVRTTVEVEGAELAPDTIDKVSAIEVEVTASPGGGFHEYLVEGKVSFQGDLVCSRCLESYPFANSSSFAVIYRPSSPEAEEAQEVELAEGELDVEFYDARQIPVRQIAAEQIGLSVPMKPLCEESCRGLCLHCGANLNRGACDCHETTGDVRWDALRGIRDELEKSRKV